MKTANAAAAPLIRAAIAAGAIIAARRGVPTAPATMSRAIGIGTAIGIESPANDPQSAGPTQGPLRAGRSQWQAPRQRFLPLQAARGHRIKGIVASRAAGGAGDAVAGVAVADHLGASAGRNPQIRAVRGGRAMTPTRSKQAQVLTADALLRMARPSRAS